MSTIRGRSGLDDVGPEGQPIDDRGGQARVSERLTPLGKGRVGGHGDRGPLVAFGQNLEQEFGTPAIQMEVELIETEQVQAPITADDSGEFVLGGRPLSGALVSVGPTRPQPPTPSPMCAGW